MTNANHIAAPAADPRAAAGPAPATILYVHSSDELYGADIILLQLITGLDRERFRPVVVLPTDLPFDGKFSAALRENGVEVLFTDLAVLRRKYFHPLRLPRFLWRLVYSVVWLLRLMAREQVALVHTNTLAVTPGVLAARLHGVPHIWHVQEILTQPRFLWRLTAWLAAQFSTVNVTVSQPTCDHLVAGNAGNADKTVVIYSAIDTKRFDGAEGSGAALRREWKVGPEETLVGMLGRFNHWKGQGYLLQVAQRVLALRPQVRFAFTGGTVSGQAEIFDRFVQSVAEMKLQDRIIISGYRSDVPAVLDAYDIFVLPSTLPDPLPTVVLEAMAMSKPVVANAHGGSIEMVAHGVTGWLAAPDDPDAMVAALLLLIDYPEMRRLFGMCARQRLDTYFSRAQFVARCTALYDKLLP